MSIDRLLDDLLFGPPPGTRLCFVDRLTRALNNDVEDINSPWFAASTRRPEGSKGSAPPPPPEQGMEGWSWHVSRGCPEMSVTVNEWSEDGSRIGGLLDCTQGSLRAICRTPTILRLMEGRLRVTPDGSPPIDLAPGDTFSCAAGFRAEWDNRCFTRQRFALVRPAPP